MIFASAQTLPVQTDISHMALPSSTAGPSECHFTASPAISKAQTARLRRSVGEEDRAVAPRRGLKARWSGFARIDCEAPRRSFDGRGSAGVMLVLPSAIACIFCSPSMIAPNTNKLLLEPGLWCNMRR
jgi:hypothetical protein